MQTKRRTLAQFAAAKETIENNSQQGHLPTPVKETEIDFKDCEMCSIDRSRIGSRSNIKALALSSRSTFEKSMNSPLEVNQPMSQPTPTFAISPSLTDDCPSFEEKENKNTLNSTQEPYHNEKIRVYGSKKLIEEENWFQFFCGEDEQDESSLSSDWEEGQQDRENVISSQEEEELLVPSTDSSQSDNDSMLSNCSTSLPDTEDISCPLGCCREEIQSRNR